MEELMDLTLASYFVATRVESWKVQNDHSASDHNYIGFTIMSSSITETYTNPRRINWTLYHKVLSDKLKASDLDKGLAFMNMVN